MGKFDEIVGYEYIKREFEDLAYTLLIFCNQKVQ